MKKLSLILLPIIILMAFSYWGYPIVKNRYFKSEDVTKNETQKSNTLLNTEEGFDSSDNIYNNDSGIDSEEESTTDDEIKDEFDESGNTSNITAEDCDNECANFKNNESNLKYCQDICDISPIKDNEDCDSKTGTDKDYCFKNQAISKTDLKICNSISDTKIKDSCKNRVTEDLLEQQ